MMVKSKKNKKVISLSTYTPNNNEMIILDTNIMLNIFTPYIHYDQGRYADLWTRIQKSQAKLIVSSIQMSEFINRCIRIEFNLYKAQNHLTDIDYKKDFRPTEDYQEKMDEILEIVNEDIVPNFVFVDDGFSKMKCSNIFIKGFSYDFNDSLLVELARNNGAVLITDDGDYCNYNIDFTIVTSNPLLLSMRH